MMPKTSIQPCDRFRSTDADTYNICNALVERYPGLGIEDFDTGVSALVVRDGVKLVVPGKPDGNVSTHEVRQLALRKATEEYSSYAQCIAAEADGDCGDFSKLFMHTARDNGMFVPWFFYDEKKLEQAAQMVMPVSVEWSESGDIVKAGGLLYGLVRSSVGYDMQYVSTGKMSVLGIDDLIERGTASCEEIAFMMKGLSLVAGMPSPTIHDTLDDDQPFDHVFSSFSVDSQKRYFVDPLREPFVAPSHPAYPESVMGSDLYAMGLYEMNYASKTCTTTECRLMHAAMALGYAPTHKNYYLMFGVEFYAGKQEKARRYLSDTCELNPGYFSCRPEK